MIFDILELLFMQIFRVGGIVRDLLMGVKPNDVDYVVVGSTPEEMLSLGFTQVGASFPVFLKDGNEYALARTERKTGVGYNGFAVEYDSKVTLEDDLIRRDLSINSMAMDDDGNIIDPYGGRDDIKNKILRHTSDAFNEDPIRVLRTCRLSARFPDFSIASETMDLMKSVVHELEFVPAERIWVEIEKGLQHNCFNRMLRNMARVGCFKIIPLLKLQPMVEDFYRAVWTSLTGYQLLTPVQKFAVVSHGLTSSDFESLRVPIEFSKVALALNDVSDTLCKYEHTTPEQKLIIFERLKAFNNDSTLLDDICAILVSDSSRDRVPQLLRTDLDKLKKVNAGEIAQMFTSGHDIKNAIRAARINALT